LHKSDFYVRGDAVCDHAYSGNVTAEAGCTTGGTKTFTCGKCGHSYTEAIAPLGHSFTDYRDDNNATCTAEGTKTAKCDRCSATDTVKAGYTLGHHCRHEVTIKPTESTAGILTTICTGCGAEWTDSLPKLSNEEYSYQVIVEPDAYNEGIGRYTWKNTDHGEVAFQVAIPKLEENPAKAGIIAENVTAKAGETVCIAVRITNNPGIAYAKLKIDYDSGLQLVSAEDQGVLKGTYTTSNSVSTKPYVVQWMGAEDSKANGCIMILTFRVPENAAAGDYGISISCEEAYNEEFADVSVAAATGVLRVSKSTPGDSNGDGKVNGKDGVLLAQYLAEWDVAVDLNAADVNGDGKVNGKDGVLLAQYLAEWDVTLK